MSNTNYTYHFLELIHAQSTFLTQISASNRTQMYRPPIKSSVSNWTSCYLDLHSKIWLESYLFIFSSWICWLIGLEPSMVSLLLMSGQATDLVKSCIVTLEDNNGHMKVMELVQKSIYCKKSSWSTWVWNQAWIPHSWWIITQLADIKGKGRTWSWNQHPSTARERNEAFRHGKTLPAWTYLEYYINTLPIYIE